MSKYIDADKLIEGIKHIQSKFPVITYEALFHLVTSLQQEQPEVDLEKFDKDVTKIWGKCAAEPNDSIACLHIETFNEIARHFYELGQSTQYQKDRGEFAKLKAKEWQEGYDEGYARGLNANKEETK